MATPLRTALFGLGKMGGFHLKTLVNDPRFEVVAIVEPQPKDAKATKGLRQVAQAAQLKGIPYDVAVIASATASHYELAKAELLAGKHLLVEKPLASTPEQAAELIALAKERNLKLAVGHVERSNPAIILAEQLLATQVLGQPVHGASQRGGGYPSGPVTGNDVLIDLAVHDLDVFSYLIGDQSFASARCHAVTHQGVIDVAEIHTKSAETGAVGTTCTATVNWLSPHRVRELRLIGSEGVLEVDYLSQKVTLSGFHIASRLQDAAAKLAERGAVAELNGGCEQVVFAAQKQDALAHQLDQFHRYLSGEAHKLCAAERTADTIAICQQAKDQFQAASLSMPGHGKPGQGKPAPEQAADRPATELN